MTSGALGKEYEDGEVIVRQGDVGNCMYVIQEGEVEVIGISEKNRPVRLAVLKEGDFFGEAAIFEQEVRTATVQALGKARLITVDKKTFLRRIQQDPSLAFRVVETLSRRVQQLNKEMVNIKSSTGFFTLNLPDRDSQGPER